MTFRYASNSAGVNVASLASSSASRYGPGGRSADAVDEAGDVDELHLDHEPRARAILAADVQDRQLRPRHQGKLLAGQVLDRDDGVEYTVLGSRSGERSGETRRA